MKAKRKRARKQQKQILNWVRNRFVLLKLFIWAVFLSITIIQTEAITCNGGQYATGSYCTPWQVGNRNCKPDHNKNFILTLN